MRLRSFTEMLLEYGIDELELDDQFARTEILLKQPYSIIVEGGHMELENLERWIKLNIGDDKVIYLYYGKTGYDFGFAEYFFKDSIGASKTAGVVSNIYTLYPHSLTPDKAFKSVGDDKEVERDLMDENSIVFKPTKKN